MDKDTCLKKISPESICNLLSYVANKQRNEPTNASEKHELLVGVECLRFQTVGVSKIKKLKVLWKTKTGIFQCVNTQKKTPQKYNYFKALGRPQNSSKMLAVQSFIACGLNG